MNVHTPVVLLFGGIGNRLFQIARAWDLKQAGKNPKVVEIEEFPCLFWILSRLLGWSKHPEWIDTLSICKRINIEKAAPTLLDRFRLLAAITRLSFSNRRSQFNNAHHLDKRSVQIGYFQSEDCITKLAVFKLATSIFEILGTGNREGPNTIVHIRGGDFDPEDRLSNALVTEFVHLHPDAICVTNDRDYVASEYPELKLSPATDAAEDFRLLANANVILPSNSTFCFWACAIAILKHNATLWYHPPNNYWNLIVK